MAQNKPWCGFKRQDGEKETGIYVGDPADKNEISIKIDVDVSEALAGLKAVQREAKEAAKAIREFETVTLHKGEVIIPLAEYLKLTEQAESKEITNSTVDNISVRNEIDVKKLAIKLSEDKTYNNK